MSAPDGLREGGQRLWLALIERDPTIPSGVRRSLAESACRAKDRSDAFHKAAEAQPMFMSNSRGRLVLNSAVREARLNAVQVTKMIAALRLPDSGHEPQQPVRLVPAAKRPAPRASHWSDGGDSSA